MTLARDAGITVVERDMPREYLYLCDELFMCGTAAEVTPIRSVEGPQIGAGKAGPVTRRMQEMFLGLFGGTTPDKHGCLDDDGRAGQLSQLRQKTNPQTRQAQHKAHYTP